MRISDWSSDVCSSDLVVDDEDRRRHRVLAGMHEDDARVAALAEHVPQRLAEGARALRPLGELRLVGPVRQHAPVVEVSAVDVPRSEERRVGKEVGGTCSTRWAPYN